MSDWPAPSEWDVGERMARAQAVELAMRALRTMPVREQDMFIAKVVDGESYADVAARYGLSVERVRQIVARCLRVMRWSGHGVRDALYGTGSRFEVTEDIARRMVEREQEREREEMRRAEEKARRAREAEARDAAIAEAFRLRCLREFGRETPPKMVFVVRPDGVVAGRWVWDE